MKKKMFYPVFGTGIMMLALPTTIYASRIEYSEVSIVKVIQEKLNAAGFDCGSPDGIAGSGTNQAIHNYRSAKGLSLKEGIDAELFNSLVLSNEQAGFVAAVSDAVDDDLGEGERVEEITLYNNDLCITVDLGDTSSIQIPVEDLAYSRVSSLTDAILELDKYDHLWETITIDFESLGEVVNDKDNMEESGFGRYFDSANFKLSSTGSNTASEVRDLSTDITSALPTGVTPEVKEFLDSYEAFMNDYCDFMENYDESDLSAMTEYFSMMQKYAEFAEKADAMDEASMTDEDYKYYIDVMARIDKRLIDVSRSY